VFGGVSNGPPQGDTATAGEGTPPETQSAFQTGSDTDCGDGSGDRSGTTEGPVGRIACKDDAKPASSSIAQQQQSLPVSQAAGAEVSTVFLEGGTKPGRVPTPPLLSYVAAPPPPRILYNGVRPTHFTAASEFVHAVSAPPAAPPSIPPAAGILHHSRATSNLARLVRPNGSGTHSDALTPSPHQSSTATASAQPLLTYDTFGTPAYPQTSAALTMNHEGLLLAASTASGSARPGTLPPDMAAAMATAAAAAGVESGAHMQGGKHDSFTRGSSAPSCTQWGLDEDVYLWLREQLPKPWRPEPVGSGGSNTWQVEELIALLANPEMLRWGHTFEQASQVNIAQINAIRNMHARQLAQQQPTPEPSRAGAHSPTPVPGKRFELERRCRDDASSKCRTSPLVEVKTAGSMVKASAESSAGASAEARAGAGAAAGARDSLARATNVDYACVMDAAHILPANKIPPPTWSALANVAQAVATSPDSQDGIADTGSEVSDINEGTDGSDNGSFPLTEGLPAATRCGKEVGKSARVAGGKRGVDVMATGSDEVSMEEEETGVAGHGAAPPKKVQRGRTEGRGDNHLSAGVRVNRGGNH
jgi:hypothetical protein